jgi:ketosteroid isomerase-like protein
LFKRRIGAAEQRCRNVEVNARAVFGLIDRLNLAGWSTGGSAGSSPLRILPAYTPYSADYPGNGKIGLLVNGPSAGLAQPVGDFAPNCVILKLHLFGGRRMVGREAMIDTINRAYAARGKGDIEGLVGTFHPDAVFELKGDKAALGIVGAVRGHSNVRAALGGFIESFEFMKRDIIDAIVEGDCACVHSRLQVRFIPKGTVFTSDVLDKFRFEDGKIIELVEFVDTALIKSVVSPWTADHNEPSQ